MDCQNIVKYEKIELVCRKGSNRAGVKKCTVN
jgi:hypothetical protein